MLLQDNAAVSVGSGTVFRDNVASYGGAIGERWQHTSRDEQLKGRLLPHLPAAALIFSRPGRQQA